MTTDSGRPLRIVQWTTGNVARQTWAVLAHPDQELVGVFAHSPDKVGVDAGELVGLDPIGVVATDDVDALLALEPDCVVYTPLHPDLDELTRPPRRRGEHRDQLGVPDREQPRPALPGRRRGRGPGR